jgi:hypothetical protein
VLLRDCSYVTGLNTCFYDRVSELGELERGFRWAHTIVLYGPRSSGKSELVRYYVSRRLSSDVIAVVFDARRKRGTRFFESLGVEVVHLDESVALRALDAILKILEGLRVHMPLDLRALTHGARELYKVLLGVVGGLSEVYVVVDEAHLLEERGAFIRDLEAVAGALAKYRELSNIRLLVTSSEGFISTSDVYSRLRGYSEKFIAVEELDEEHFKMLYEEYCSKRGGCITPLNMVEAIAGRLPGYIVEVESKARNGELEAFIRVELGNLLEAMVKASSAEGVGLEQLARKLIMAFEGSIRYYEVGLKAIEVLIEENVIYKRGLMVKPQLALYARALKLAVERGVTLDSLAEGGFDARELLEL